MIRPVLHLILHIIVPFFPAKYFYAKRWRVAYLLMLGTMLVDLDHLFVEPVYAPNRCSIGFHPLHSYGAVAIYFVLSVIKKTRLIAIGLIIHMTLDGLDCFWMSLE